MIPNPNQLTAELRSMTDAQLQQYAQMHKNDPYILPMALSESNARKMMRMQAQAQQFQPQPTERDKALMSMQANAEPLPEEVGIGALPAQNLEGMADGGIVGYADGGGMMGDGYNMAVGYEPNRTPAMSYADGGEVESYAPGGSTSSAKTRFIQEYGDAADQVSAETGIDRNLLLAQWGHETAWGTKTVGKYNLGNIKDVTGKGPVAVDKMEKSKASYKEYGSPQEFAADYTNLIKRNFPGALNTGSDVGAFTEGLQSGKKGAYASDPDYRKKIARTATSLMPVSSAQAAAPATPEPEGASDALAASGTVGGATGVAGAGIAALTAKELANVGSTAARESAGTLARRALIGGAGVPGAVAAGGAGLSGYANRKVAEMSPEQREEFYTNPMIGAMGGDTALAAAIMNAGEGRIKPPEKPTPYLEQMSKALGFMGKAVVGHPDVWRGGSEKPAAAEPARDTSYDRAEMAKFQRQAQMRRAEEQAPDLTKKEESAVIDLAKKAAPEGKKQGWTAEDWIQLGLGLLAGQSPHALQNLGAAGLGVMKAKQEARKEEREDVYRRALAREAEAKATYYESGTGDVAKATAYADKAFDNWLSGVKANPLLAMNITPEQVEAKRQQFLREAYTAFKIQAPAGAGAAPTTTGNRLMFNPQTGKIE